MSRQGWTKTSVLKLNHNHRNVNQGTATASTLRGFHHLYNNFKKDTTTTGMSIKGQQLRLHYEDFTTYIITLNRTPQPQECLSKDSNCVYTTRISPPIYSNFYLDTTTTGMSIKGQQLRLHYEDFTTYIITLNRTPQPQECLSRDSNCVYTMRISPPIYSIFYLDTTTTGMSIKGQQLRLHYEDFTTYIITLNWTPQPQEC